MTYVTNGTLTVSAEVINAQLERSLRREALSRIGAAASQIQSGVPGLLAGQLTFLCDTLDVALTLDALYAGTAAVTMHWEVATVVSDPDHPGMYLPISGLVPDPDHPGGYLILTPTAVDPLDGLKHVAVGRTRLAAERATPGRSAKWLLTAEIVEVP